MRSVTARGFALSLVLSGTAGYVDAIGFIDTGGFFVSFMSGNSTQAGVELFDQGISAVLMPFSLVAAFVLGVTVGAVLNADGRRKALTVAVSALTVGFSAALAATLPHESWRYWALAFAMGALNTLYLADGRARVAITYATGTLVSLGLSLAALVTGRSRTAWRRPFLLWAALAAGAVVGAAAHRWGSGIALALAVLVLALAAFVLALSRRGQDAEGAA